MSEGPSEEQIAGWKSEYNHIFSVDDGRQLYVFRPLTFKEYDNALAIDDKEGGVAAEDYIVLQCILFPEIEDSDNMKAGVFDSLSAYILDFSGFGDVRTAIDIMQEKRAEMDDVKNLMFNFVLSVMNYKPEELEELDFRSLAEKVAAAERIIQIKQQINNPSVTIEFQIQDPDEVEEKTEEPDFDPIAAKLQQALGG